MKNLLYIIILILAIISLTFAYQYYKNKKIIKEDKIIKNNMENKINALEKHIYFNNQVNNFKLNKNLEFFSVKKDNKILLKNLMRNSIKLVFYIPPNLCNTCYKKKIKLLKEHIKIIGAKNILILLPLNKIRQYKSIFQKYNIKNDIYTYNKNEAIFMQNKILAPLYFTIDLNHKVNNFFIIHKNHNLVNRYIKIIKNKYF